MTDSPSRGPFMEDMPRYRAWRALLDEFGLPTKSVSSVEMRLTNKRSGDHLTVKYSIVSDDPFGRFEDDTVD